ncbi:helix-turn-helix domain-containing protein [Microtetraspora malaysiensis]|uniref:helix-turn-helix domain-containing protein n=1 Tax=Microtetraspora malaysiensis TaxID=161358 RepID=UPI003D8C7FAB
MRPLTFARASVHALTDDPDIPNRQSSGVRLSRTASAYGDEGGREEHPGGDPDEEAGSAVAHARLDQDDTGHGQESEICRREGVEATAEEGASPGGVRRRGDLGGRARAAGGRELSVEQIAGRCGFGTTTMLRRHFLRMVGTTPTAYRRTFARA